MSTQPTLELFGDHNERELDLEWVAERKALGLCTLVNGRCWTHETVDSMEHHFTTHPGAFNE